MMHKQEEAFCGSFTKIVVLFEYHENNLSKDFSSRSQAANHYSEAELWNIIDSIVLGCSFLQENGILHSDICPWNVMLTHGGYVKVGEYSLITRGLSGYFKLFSQKSRSCYLSPQLFLKLKKREIRPKVNPYKSDVFSMGMVILQAVSLRDVNNCYNFKNGTMHHDEIKRRL